MANRCKLINPPLLAQKNKSTGTQECGCNDAEGAKITQKPQKEYQEYQKWFVACGMPRL